MGQFINLPGYLFFYLIFILFFLGFQIPFLYQEAKEKDSDLLFIIGFIPLILASICWPIFLGFVVATSLSDKEEVYEKHSDIR